MIFRMRAIASSYGTDGRSSETDVAIFLAQPFSYSVASP
jgi:hypothetical protein